MCQVSSQATPREKSIFFSALALPPWSVPRSGGLPRNVGLIFRVSWRETRGVAHRRETFQLVGVHSASSEATELWRFVNSIRVGGNWAALTFSLKIINSISIHLRLFGILTYHWICIKAQNFHFYYEYYFYSFLLPWHQGLSPRRTIRIVNAKISKRRYLYL